MINIFSQAKQRLYNRNKETRTPNKTVTSHRAASLGCEANITTQLLDIFFAMKQEHFKIKDSVPDLQQIGQSIHAEQNKTLKPLFYQSLLQLLQPHCDVRSHT